MLQQHSGDQCNPTSAENAPPAVENRSITMRLSPLSRSDRSGRSGSQFSPIGNDANVSHQGDGACQYNYRQISAYDLIISILERTQDPILQEMLDAHSEKILKDLADLVEADMRSRSLPVSGLEEPLEGTRASERSPTETSRWVRAIHIVPVWSRSSYPPDSIVDAL
ncbi:hypothetical protein ANCDUO_00416 [Ancylostoma duodenale]|uniref:Uncharacterized protein n=1 Tax=Ancylostoma duodenale TaxID=51022 RepID=A0A0C2H5W7_9BILA|nr:hypothetical protein ANCDUO_00416 [Ancylostoma duodenale]